MTTFREYMTRWVLRVIDDEFSSAGVVAATATDVEVTSGERRLRVELYYASLDLSNRADVRKLLGVFESVLMDASSTDPASATKLHASLTRDGYRVVDNRIRESGSTAAKHLATKLEIADAQQIRDTIKRMEDALEGDPALAIGSAKELIESVCKTILDAKGVTVASDADLGVLVKATTKLLRLAPEDITEAAKGADLIKKTLHSLSAIVGYTGELRSLYGTGHGKRGSVRGLQPRHARLVVGAASALVTFLWETYTDRHS